MVTFEDIVNDKDIKIYVNSADKITRTLGYTDHSAGHTLKVSNDAANILKQLKYSEKEIEHTKIAGYLHDIGNIVNRVDHAFSGGIIAFQLLSKKGMAPEDIAEIVGAIGNHDEDSGVPVSPMSAALIIADKADVRRSRVRNRDLTNFDIHDRVNYAVLKNEIEVIDITKNGNGRSKEIVLKFTVDEEIYSIAEYFEIFLRRMLMCKRAAEYLKAEFTLEINNKRIL